MKKKRDESFKDPLKKKFLFDARKSGVTSKKKLSSPIQVFKEKSVSAIPFLAQKEKQASVEILKKAKANARRANPTKLATKDPDVVGPNLARCTRGQLAKVAAATAEAYRKEKREKKRKVGEPSKAKKGKKINDPVDINSRGEESVAKNYASYARGNISLVDAKKDKHVFEPH